MKLYRKLPTITEESVKPREPAHTEIAVQPFAIRLAVGFTGLVLLTLVLSVLSRFALTHDTTSAMAVIQSTLTDKMFWSAVMVGFMAYLMISAIFQTVSGLGA